MESIGALLEQIAKDPPALSGGELAQLRPASSSQESRTMKKKSAIRSRVSREHKAMVANRQK